MLEGIGILAVVVAAGIAALAAMRRDPRIDGPFIRSSVVLLIGYFAVCGAGVAIVVAVIPGPASQMVAGAATVFVLAWIALASLWLIRLAPHAQEPPAALMRPWSGIDWGLIAVAAVALGFVVFAG